MCKLISFQIIALGFLGVILFGTIFEFADLELGKRILCSLFQSATPRTAGFNTVDLASMRESGQSVIILLMLVGGSPGSTAGGMKTTTVAVLFATAFSTFSRTLIFAALSGTQRQAAKLPQEKITVG